MTTSEQGSLSERQSLDLIQNMIRQAQARFTNDGSHLIWWGSLVFVAALGHFALLRTPLAQQAGIVWLLMPVGAIGAYLIARRQGRIKGVRTFIDRMMASLWGCIGGSIGLVFLLVSLTGSLRAAYPIILLLYGIGLICSGSMLRFTPMLIGGILCWVLAVVAAIVHFDSQLLCMAGAAAAGFLVPGLLVRSKFQTQQTVMSNAASTI